MKRFFSSWWQPSLAIALVVVSAAFLTRNMQRRSSTNELREAKLSSTFPARGPETNPFPARSDVRHDDQIVLCQAPSPAAPLPVPYADCINGPCEITVNPLSPFEFQKYAQGEYVGRARLQHVPEYRLRVDDQLNFIYRLTRNETRAPYELSVGDEIRIESFTEKSLDRVVTIQPDGTISLPFVNEVRATRHTVAQLRDALEKSFKTYLQDPAITITPIKVNTRLDDLRNAIGGRSGLSPQVIAAKLTPAGEVSLPADGTVPAQGLTIEEFKTELDARYAALVDGVEVTPVLTQRAPRYVYVLGEVNQPGRYSLEAPTTVMQAIAMAGSWNFGANIQQAVVFRRADDWRLIATALDLRAALLGRQPCPASEIWVSDADLIILPKGKILLTDNWINLVFTKGIYGVAPFTGSISFTNLSYLNNTAGS